MADKYGFPQIKGYRYVKKKSYTKGTWYPALVVDLEAVDGGIESVTCLIRYDKFRILGITEDMFPKEEERR